jgi:hypothetical protein
LCYTVSFSRLYYDTVCCATLSPSLDCIMTLCVVLHCLLLSTVRISYDLSLTSSLRMHYRHQSSLFSYAVSFMSLEINNNYYSFCCLFNTLSLAYTKSTLSHTHVLHTHTSCRCLQLSHWDPLSKTVDIIRATKEVSYSFALLNL